MLRHSTKSRTFKSVEAMIPSNSVIYRSARVRSLTERGQEQYEETLEKCSAKLRSIGRDIDKLLQEVENEAPNDQSF